MDNEQNKQSILNSREGWRKKLYNVIFESETAAGKTFDILLIWAIVLSVLTVVIDSVDSIRSIYGTYIWYIEWFFTILFSIEYILRLIAIPKPIKYMVSFYGISDLLAIIPTYLSLFFAGTQALLVIRSLRLLRIFRILKLSHYMGEANLLLNAIRSSRIKIAVFLYSVVILVTIIGSMMYLIEGPEHGFKNIPTGIYWAVVTLTTVGYGDISPKTPLGQSLSMIVMILGFGIIAIPTGIVTAELTLSNRNNINNTSTNTCPHCLSVGHDIDAVFCKYCGGKM